MARNRSEAPQGLPRVAPNRPVALIASGTPVTGAMPEVSLPLSHYSWLLRTHLIRILTFVALVVIATTLVTVRITPTYESTATVYVDRAAERDVVGKDAQASATASADADVFLASQIKLLQTDAVVRPLAEKYNLLERERQVKPGSDDAAKIARIRSGPIVLKGLRIGRVPNTYVLQITYRSADPKVATEVANGIADSYIEHIYAIRIRSSEGMSKFLARQLEELRVKMESSSSRLAVLERELGLTNPEEKTNILSARLLQLNTEYTRVQAERAQKQSANNSLGTGSLESALGSSQSEELKSIMKRLNDEKQRFADVKARFGENHPEYARLQATVAELEAQQKATVQLLSRQTSVEFQRAQNQEVLLKKDLDETKAAYDALNLRSFGYQRAKQEADADRLLYEELVRKIREGEINSGFKNDMVRVADPARPGSKPVSPILWLNLTLATFLSLIFGVLMAIVSDRIDTTIKNPEQVTLALHTRVLGTLPILKKGSADVTRGPGQRLIGAGSGTGTTVAASHFEEAIRTIRNSMLLTDFERGLRSVVVTSATPSEGKSTVVAHLAVAHAEQRHKTLLIDADMRRPSLHRLFHVHNTAGLSNSLEKGLPWRDLVTQPFPELDLYLLTAGPASRRAPDMVGQSLPQLLEDAAEEFDMIYLDAPPLLGFPEPLQIAAAVDGVVVVARAGQTERTAVAAVLDTLQQLRANVVGLILNEVRKETSSSYYYYGGNYGKYYAKRKEEAEP